MENETNRREQEILFSRAVKAGKRIYYLDVKRSRGGDQYLSITESKKVISGEGLNEQVSFEKHKIFLYAEDFAKFNEAMHDVMQFVAADENPEKPSDSPKFDIDMNFDL